MKKEEIKQAAAEFSKTRTMPPEGKRLYSFEELQDFAISIHDQALEEAITAAQPYVAAALREAREVAWNDGSDAGHSARYPRLEAELRAKAAEIERLKQCVLNYESEIAEACPEDQSIKETMDALRKQLAASREREQSLEQALDSSDRESDSYRDRLAVMGVENKKLLEREQAQLWRAKIEGMREARDIAHESEGSDIARCINNAIQAATVVSTSHRTHYCPGSDKEQLPDCIEIPLTPITKLQIALRELDAARKPAPEPNTDKMLESVQDALRKPSGKEQT